MTRTLLAVFAAFALAACAAPAPANKPSPTKTEDPPLPVAAFIDSAGLHQALLAAPPAPQEFTRRPIFSVRYDSTGALLEVEPIFARLAPAEYARTMAALLRAHVKPSISTTRESWQRVWLQSGATPKIAVLDDGLEVRPQMNNRVAVGRELNSAVQRLLQIRPDLAGREFTGTVSMRVTEDGLPTNSLIRRSTGVPDVDRAIIAVARTMRFSPARLDEYPVSVIVQVPVTLHFPAAQAQPAAGERP